MATLNNSFKMSVSEKLNGKYVERGVVIVPYPLLTDMGLDAEVKETSEDGFPVYSNDLHQFTFEALLASIKAAARNKLQIVNGVVGLKDGCTIAATTEALLESGGNNGAALAAMRAFNEAFKAWANTLGKKESIVSALCMFMRQPDTIALADEDKRERILGYLTDFVGTLTVEQRTQWARRITQISEMCESSPNLDDDEGF